MFPFCSNRVNRPVSLLRLRRTAGLIADSDECGHRFRLKADSIPIDCGQHSDDPGQGASADGRQGVTEGDRRQALTVLAPALRMLSPFKVSLWALCTSRSRMASATVGFAIASCQ
jgi:hypothetical protein